VEDTKSEIRITDHSKSAYLEPKLIYDWHEKSSERPCVHIFSNNENWHSFEGTSLISKMSIVLSLGTPTRTVIQNTVTRRGVVKVKYRFCGSCGACSRNVQVRQMTVTVVLTRGASMNRCSDVRWPANPIVVGSNPINITVHTRRSWPESWYQGQSPWHQVDPNDIYLGSSWSHFSGQGLEWAQDQESLSSSSQNHANFCRNAIVHDCKTSCFHFVLLRTQF
jgi:hypothetical protein